MLVSWSAGFVIRRAAPRIGLVDHPAARKVHTRVTPLGGGIAIWLGVVLPLAGAHAVAAAAWFGRPSSTDPARLAIPLPAFVAPHVTGFLEQAPQLWLLLAAGTLLMLLGLTDDLRGLDWRPRLAIEFLVAGLIVWQGWRLTIFLSIPWLTDLLSVLWIVGLVNSFNFLDNMDGLSGGVAAIAAAMLATVMLLAPDPFTHQPQLFVAGFLLVLVGSLLGFLWHNRPPARLFMGDAGSYFIGFMLAVATMAATFAGGDVPRHAILAPLCVLAIPLYDTLTVVIIRLREGRSPFAADKNHFSHRLAQLGMTKSQAVLTIYLATATTGLGALLLYQVDLAGAAVILLLVACVLLLVTILETAARRR
ncbi:MAG: undecaprenyl/decaprenyl-phosphate alpha-N-acetylglucosaminyl 1-phosphate transferase [Pirellulales bacterium]|nr:undecaprenyl/decaprenyl-phosphate alpha-N-acetylglucosaminyl 1-phosphate transferase [Pirellulales bacterium]